MKENNNSVDCLEETKICDICGCEYECTCGECGLENWCCECYEEYRRENRCPGFDWTDRD